MTSRYRHNSDQDTDKFRAKFSSAKDNIGRMIESETHNARACAKGHEYAWVRGEIFMQPGIDEAIWVKF